jgi:hypothetical protein
VTKETPPSLRQVLRRKWLLLLALPLLNLLLVGVFWQSQIQQYAHTTKGVVFAWLVAGLIFVVIQLSLQASALRQRLHEESSSAKHLEIVWSLAAQVVVFVVMAVYNIIALIALWQGGGRPVGAYNMLIAALVAATLCVAAWRYRRSLRDPGARLLLATGTKALPQWVQAGSLAVVGSAGMHPLTISAITAMGVLRFILSHHAAAHFKTKETVAADKGSFRDLLSIGAMCIGWVIGAIR